MESFIFMQLVEFFIWRNINNKYYNHLFSALGCVLLLIQPIISITFIRNKQLKNILYILFLSSFLPYLILSKLDTT